MLLVDASIKSGNPLLAPNWPLLQSYKSGLTSDDEYEKEFLEQEVQFTLSQQIIDLQQTLAATAQGTVAFGIIVKGNQELIRTIRRSQNVTVVALNVGSAVATGLAKRRNALKTVEEVTTVTNNMLKLQEVIRLIEWPLAASLFDFTNAISPIPGHRLKLW